MSEDEYNHAKDQAWLKYQHKAWSEYSDQELKDMLKQADIEYHDKPQSVESLWNLEFGMDDIIKELLDRNVDFEGPRPYFD